MGVKLSIDTYLFDEYLVGSEKQVQKAQYLLDQKIKRQVKIK